MVNILGGVLCAIASMILGTLWYGPFFGKTWMKISGIKKPKVITREIKKQMFKSYFLMFLGSIITAFVLSNFMIYTEISAISVGLWFGFFMWLGFIAPVMMSSSLWEGKSWKLYFINSLYFLVNLEIMTLILHYVR